MGHRLFGAVAGEVWISGGRGRSFRAADQEAFLKQEELQDEQRWVVFGTRDPGGERPVYVMGGGRLDKEFPRADLAGWQRAAAVSESGDRFSRITDRSFRIFFHFYIFFDKLSARKSWNR